MDEAYDEINKKAEDRRALSAFANSSMATGSEGVTGTARLSESVNYENIRNANADARAREQEEISRAAIELGLTNDANVANLYAQNILSRIEAQMDENQFAYEYDFNEEDEAINEALTRTQEFGKVMTKNDAKILGVPVGTSVRKVTAQRSSGGSGKKSSSSGGAQRSAAAQAVANDPSKLNRLRQVYNEGMKAGSGSKGSSNSNQTSYYQAYLNQINNSNLGQLGDDAARKYLSALGVTDPAEQSDLMAEAGISEYTRYASSDKEMKNLVGRLGLR